MKVTEDNFITQLRLRNEKALEYVIDVYGDLVATIVNKHLFALREHQGECMDDVLLAVWYHIDGFDEEKGTFAKWIAGVAKYKSLTYLRKYLNKKEHINIEDVEIVVEDKEIGRLLEREWSDEVENMLSCLNERDKALFIELFAYERDMDEVSKTTGMKKEVIYNRVSRGKHKIRDRFKMEKKNLY